MDSVDTGDDDHDDSLLRYLYAESTAARPDRGTAQCRHNYITDTENCEGNRHKASLENRAAERATT
jgi:hypothetical protein